MRWPRSLQSQVLLAIAMALFLAQGIGALLIYRAQHERIEGSLVHTAAFRVGVAARSGERDWRIDERAHPPGPLQAGLPPSRGRVERTSASPARSAELRETAEETELRRILEDQDLPVADVAVVHRMVGEDERAQAQLVRRLARDPASPTPRHVLVAGVRLRDSDQWLVTRVFMPPTEQIMLRGIVWQTLLIYTLLVGAMWWLLRRITRPLAALTTRLERFADTRDPGGQLEPQGPEDVARLITAHNAMEARIAALLDEKDVMLGAIGHDLKTPLAALRVRIESVDDDTERGRMASTIEDITRTLDDILSLARVGRPSDPREMTELSALVAAVVEEFEDMGEPVELGDTVRMALPLRATWIRRALRNLIGNALRYGAQAEVALAREGGEAVIRIRDSGPGIAEDRIGAMMEPFTRGEPSRNSETGGAGLGLTLAKAIAEQHGGTLTLVNHRRPGGQVSGLEAILRLPIN